MARESFTSALGSGSTLAKGIPWMLGIALALVPFLLLFELFVPGEHKYILGDSVQLYWADMSYLFRSVMDGHLPLWDPYERAGDPFWTDPQSAIFYPVNYIFVAVGAILDGFPYILQEIRLLIHISIGGVGIMVLLWRGFGLNLSAAVIGSIIFMLQPFFTGHIQHILILPCAFFPWAAWMLLRLRAKGEWSDAAWLTLLVGLILTSGSPPSAYYALLGVTIVGTATLFLGVHESNTSWRRFLALSVGAGIAGFGLALPSLVPSALHLPYSVANERSFGYLSSLSVPLKHASSLVWRPGHMSQEEWLFWGLVPLGLSCLAILQHRRDRRRWAFVWWAVAIFFTLVMFGRDLPVFAAFVKIMPGAGLFRHPGRYMSVVGFAIPILSAFGFSALLHYLAKYLPVKRKLGSATMLILTLLTVVWLLISLGDPMRDMAIRNTKKDITSRDSRALELEGLETEWRVLDEGYIGNGMGDRLGLRDFRGYATNFVFKRWAKMRKAMPKHTDLLALFGIRYYAAHPRNYHATVPKINKVAEYRHLKNKLYENKNVMPAAFWVRNGCAVSSEDEALKRVSRDNAYTNKVILEKTIPETQNIPKCSARKISKRVIPDYSISTSDYVPASLVNLQPNSVEVKVDAPRAGWLVVNEAWYPGWVAYVDGKRVEAVAANYLQRAVPCPAGKRIIRFAFEPVAFWPSVLVAMLILFAVLLMIIVPAFRKRFKREKVVAEQIY